EPMLSCTGRLLDSEGKPTAGTPRIRYEDGSSQSATAAANGEFRFPIKPGLRYRLCTYEPRSSSFRFSGVLAGEVSGIELRLPGTGSGDLLSITATDAASGKPLAEFSVQVDWQQADFAESHVWFSQPFAGGDGALQL